MTRPVAWFAAAFSLGVFLARYLLGEAVQPLFAAGFALLAFLGLLQKEKADRQRVLLAGFAIAFAICWNMSYTALVQTPARAYADTVTKGEALVTRYAEALDSEGWGKTARCRIRVKLMTETGDHNAYLYGGSELLEMEPGNVLRGELAVTDASAIDGEEITSFTSKNVYLLLFLKGEMSVETGDAGSLLYLPQRMAHRVEETVETLYEGDTAALVLALLTGDKSGFSDEMYTVLAEAGILHIASVSGLHCMFLLSMIRLLTGKRRGLVAGAGVPLLLFYAFMVGAVPSVLRAVIMVLFLLVAPLLRRESDSLTSFSVALMLILLLNPFAAGSVSLQLSFAAAGGMLWLTPKLYRFLTGEKGRNRLWNFLAASISATAGALVFTTPLSAWYFNSLVLISPLSNILTLTAVNALFSFSLLTVPAAVLLPSAAAILAWPGKALAWYVLTVSRALAVLPGHAVYFESIYILCWLGFAYLLLAIVALRRTGTREKILACAAAVLSLAVAVAFTQHDYRYGEMNIVALDVGQGQSILVTSGSETVLIDCGSSNNFISAGDVAGDMVMTMGGTLDYLVLTHFHTDHANGLPTLFSRVEVKQMLAPRPRADDEVGQAVLRMAGKYGVEVVFIEEDTSYAFGEAELRLFSPVEGLAQEDENENGLSVVCTAGDFDFLVTGDMSRATEEALIEQKNIPDVELMMVGHHGSNGSSSEKFLAAVKPETVIISVGDNSYGHPAGKALQRLAKYDVELYRTDEQGHIRVSVR